MSSADAKNDMTGNDVPGGDPVDNDYKSRTGQHQIPVQSDETPVSDPIDPATADSDETLGGYTNVVAAKDDSDAIDQSNIIGGRTRGAKPSGGYAEPGDEEGLPGAEDGTSSTR
ncbi:MAG: hypothetical protein ASARMPREDX12_007500 [Alectoria sarmentosa]|nr:MAG: hypothetical protein ASARMPREDX12_007500 [Alectoria sarmentosa]